MSDSWTNMLWWLTRLFERLGERPWVGQLQAALSDASRWLLGSGTPVVGGLMVLLAGAMVVRALRENSQRRHPPRSDWVADRLSQDSAGRWHPTMSLNRSRRADVVADAARLLRVNQAKKAKRA